MIRGNLNRYSHTELIWLLALLVLIGGCAALGQLARSAQGSQWLGSVLDVAAAGADAYFDRHPSLEREQQVRRALRVARTAQEALDAALAVADAADAGDVQRARTAALQAYSALRDLLGELGILDGRPPPGGADAGGPDPGPLELPTSAELAAAL
jgi:hypothetical protein